MPIGKNAIKRISNNGYSNVKATAPDMENSTVIAVEEKQPEAKKSEIKKSAPKPQAKPKAKEASIPKKSMEKEPDLSPVKTAERVTKKSSKKEERRGSCYINIGGELPYYLL